MTRRLEKGECLKCGITLIAFEKALCSQCTEWYHRKLKHIYETCQREKVPPESRNPSLRMKLK
jgi:hypothetical protein